MNKINKIIHSTLKEGYNFFITDKWNIKYHFKIATFMVPSGMFSEAHEVTHNDADNEPRIFHILSDYDCNIEQAELLLKERIKKSINKRYLEHKDGHYLIGPDLEVAGRILYDEDLITSKSDNLFEIDGKKVSIEKFIQMLKGFEGWNFKFQILDTTEDLER